jgi:3-hydroxybutyryl-CoA dehydrogenase
MTSSAKPPVGVVGAGTMGAGIAQVAAVAGRRVLLADAIPGAAEAAIVRIRDQVRARVARGRLDADPDALAITANSVDELADCEVVAEAIVEDLAAKRALFAELEKVVSPGCVLASNSSSLSPTAMAAGLTYPERLVGLHFFNPAPAMRLVEVISGLATSAQVASRAAELAREWGKTVVRAAAAPGFIVNRIARPFYAEAWRLHEEHAAAAEVIDAVLTGAGGFRMGPFALMDLIGHDVNEAVTRSVWAAFGHDPRYMPSLAQRALVEAGWLGRKSGRGVYSYAAAAAPPSAVPAAAAPPPAEVTTRGVSPLRPLLSGVRVVTGERGGVPDGFVELPSGALLAQCYGTTATALAAATRRPVIVADRTRADPSAIAVAACDGCPASAVPEAIGLFQAAGLDVFVIGDVPGLIVARTVAMLANLAADALAAQVASADDIDTAMRLGVNYPVGPLAWARQWGISTVLTILDNLENWYRDGHYRASPLLRRAALSGQELA